jgi:hypothetical protein
MKKSAALLLILLAVATGSGAQERRQPVFTPGVPEFQARTAALVNSGSFQPFLELAGRFEDAEYQFRYRALTAGSYFRVHRNLKLGAFYRLQTGALHDDDWGMQAGTWGWADTRDRMEHLLILDASPRFLLDFLPGRNWVFMLKGRYELNSFDLQQTLLVQPGLTYFWMRNREPVLNISLNYGLYFPLNFGDTLIYEHAPYLELLYHLSPTVKLELTGTYRLRTWSTSEDFLSEFDGATYSARSGSFVLGFGAVFALAR